MSFRFSSFWFSTLTPAALTPCHSLNALGTPGPLHLLFQPLECSSPSYVYVLFQCHRCRDASLTSASLSVPSPHIFCGAPLLMDHGGVCLLANFCLSHRDVSSERTGLCYVLLVSQRLHTEVLSWHLLDERISGSVWFVWLLPHPIFKMSKLTPPKRNQGECSVARVQGASGEEIGSRKLAGGTCNQKDQDQLGSR